MAAPSSIYCVATGSTLMARRLTGDTGTNDGVEGAFNEELVSRRRSWNVSPKCKQNGPALTVPHDLIAVPNDELTVDGVPQASLVSETSVMRHRPETMVPVGKPRDTNSGRDTNRADYDTAANAADSGEVLPFAKSMRGTASIRRRVVVAVVEPSVAISQELRRICEFLDIALLRVPSDTDLASVLRTKMPMAVACALDGAGQDGCHIMMTVAHYDASLPIMIVTGDDPALIGAADAVEEIWQLTEVTKLESLPRIAGLADFLIHAGLKGNCLGLKPARG